MENKQVESLKDVNDYIADVISETPMQINVDPDFVTTQVENLLNETYGEDASNVRSIMTRKQLRQYVMSHCRRAYERPEDDENQLGFTEWGNDIQDRYPVIEDGAHVYASPKYADVKQLYKWIDTHELQAETLARRAEALRGFIKKHRNG